MDQATDGAAGAGAGGQGAAPAGTGAAPAPGAGTALSAAAAAAQPAAQPGGQAEGAPQVGADPFAAINAKFHVKAADGTLDKAATAAKVWESYSQLEQRLGSGEAPPATADAYKPDAVYAAIKEKTGKDFSLPPEFVGDFNKFAHDAKLNQAQYEKALGGMLQMTQGMVEQGFQHAMATGQAELEKVWGADAKNPKSERMQNAWRGFQRFAPESLRTPDTMDAIGNHPVVMQILEAVGRELKSDHAPNEQGGAVTGANRLDSIYADPAYLNAKDPRHAALVQEAQQLFAKGLRPTMMQGRGGRTVL